MSKQTPDPSGLDPVAAYLDESETTESAVHRVWRGVDQRLTPKLPIKRQSPAQIAVGFALAAAAVLTFLFWPQQPAPIALLGGGALVATEVSAESRHLLLDDGSKVHVSPGARVVPTRNDAGSLAMRVEGGRVRFEVEPGGPRAWDVHTALFSVRVVGTVFVVQESATGGRVRVERGEVLVTELATGETSALHAGDERRFERPTGGADSSTTASAVTGAAETVALRSAGTSAADGSSGAAGSSDSPPGSSPRAGVAESAAGTPAVDAPAQDVPDWRQLARAGEFNDAYEALGDTVPVGADLLLAVDVARRTGHEARAVAMLEAILNGPAQSDETALAAITLGRIERRRRHYAAALAAFERARAIGVPSSFADEVCAERALARHESGDRAGARQIAGECLGLNGSSVYASRLRPLLRAE